MRIGVGFNMPGIVEYNFWRQTYTNHNVVYACLNFNEAYAPEEITERCICIDGDLAEAIR